MASVEGSLARLDTPYLGLYQCHRFDPETPLSETILAMTEPSCAHASMIAYSRASPSSSR